MIWYIVAFATGIVTGSGLLILHQKGVENAVKAERQKYNAEKSRQNAQIARLRENYNALEQSFAAREARSKGLSDGLERGKRMTAAERLAANFDGRRTVDIRDTTRTA